MWNLDSPNPHFTLEGHSKGINCVDFFTASDKPYLVTGSDDFTAMVCGGNVSFYISSASFSFFAYFDSNVFVLQFNEMIRFGTIKLRLVSKL